MRVELSSAFAQMAGQPCLELSLPEPASVRQVLALLAGQCEAFRKYLAYQDDALLGAHLSVVSQGKFLKLDDLVADQDVLKLLLPVTGG